MLGGVARKLQAAAMEPKVTITRDSVTADASGARNAVLDNIAVGNVLIVGTRVP